MKYLIALFVFCLILFLYIHIYFQLVKNNDLEVLVVDNDISKEYFEEVCNLRQPIIFNFYEEEIETKCNHNYILNNYGVFDINVRTINNSKNTVSHLPMALETFNKLKNDDNDSKMLSEKNQNFLDETSMIKILKYNDIFLRPYLVSNCYYDMFIGSNETTSPLVYNLNFRNFYYCTEESFKVILIPPKFSKYLYPVKNYETFEFISPVNPWNIQSKYKNDFDKLKTLEVEVKKGECLYIPAYWWYSIQFKENTFISVFQYRTYMNNVAILPHLSMKLLQNQNIKREMVKKASQIKTIVNSEEEL
jgi:hypothetical protein